jgi:hypothetical protein
VTESRSPAIDEPRQPASSRGAVFWLTYLLAAAWIGGVLAFASLAPDRYEAAMQEDRPVEWATVVLFVAAGIARLRQAVPGRRAFDFFVALFCLFVAGEEFSWGQRLLGFTPPEAFLERNTQQEFNIHNFADVFGRPKWMLMMALAGYGLVLPPLARVGATRGLLERVGSTPPPLALVPWFAAAIALLYWYPLTFTGEWVEALAGTLFVAAAPLSLRVFVSVLVATPAVALVMTQVSAMRRVGDPALVTCASAEAHMLLSAVVDSSDTADGLRQGGSVHKRVWTSVQEGYLDESVLRSFDGVPCRGEHPDDQASRRRYAIDPWGTAYWVYTLPKRGGVRPVGIYSFGPNRRRDGEPGMDAGDDVTAAGELEVR